MSRPRSRVRYDLALERRTMRLAQQRAIPTVDPWMAGEMFLSQHIEERKRGLAILVGSDTARRSPLTMQLLSTRLEEPDLGLRFQIAAALADYFEVRGREYRYAYEVRAAITAHLRKFERQQFLSLLEIYDAFIERRAHEHVDKLLQLFERIPNAALTLSKIACDRSLELCSRRAAIDAIGQVGFMDAADALLGLEARLSGRRAGQLAMTFAPASDHAEEQSLLPTLQRALKLLAEG